MLSDEDAHEVHNGLQNGKMLTDPIITQLHKDKDLCIAEVSQVP